MERVRLAWVDIFRGLAIVLVVIGHANSPFTALIYSFHIPVFFFISGYATDLRRGTFGSYAAGKFSTLLAPFFYLNIALLLLIILFSAAWTTRQFLDMPMDGEDVVPAIEQLFSKWLAPTSWAGATWFLPVLFFSSCVARLLQDLSQSSNTRFAGLVCLVTIPVVFLAAAPKPMPLELDLSFLGLPFFLGGALARRAEVFDRRIDHRFMAPIAVLALWAAYRQLWIQIDFPSRTFSPYYQIVFYACCGGYALWLASRALEHFGIVARLMQYIGRESLWILGFHFMGFKVSVVLLTFLGLNMAASHKILAPPDTPFGVWTVHTIVAIAFSLAAAVVFRWIRPARSAAA